MKCFRRLLGTFLMLLFIVSPSYGGGQDQDGAFAKMLLQWGYADLAEECANNILKGKDFVGDGRARRDDFQRGDAQYVLVELEKYRSEQATSEKNRQGHLKKYKRLLRAFQKRYAGHPQALSASLNLILSDRREAVRQFKTGRVETVESKKKRLFRKGVKLFESVLGAFDKLINSYQKSIDTQVTKVMKVLKAKEKDSFAREDIDDYSTMQYLLYDAKDQGFRSLVYQRVLAELIRGETCLLYIRWQERLDLNENQSKYLSVAKRAFKTIEEDYSNLQNLAGKAGLGYGEVLMRQGKLKQAIDKYDSFTLFKFNPPSQDDNQRAWEESFAKDISSEAYHGLANCWIRKKRYDNAIKLVDKMFSQYKDALSYNGGRMALLSKCEALTLSEPPQPYKAMEEAMKIVEWSKKSEPRFAGRDFGRSALQAALRMSEIREGMKGQVEFNPEISLLIATGFFERGKYDWAIYAYKDVLSSSESEEDSVVLAIKGLANCYYSTRRYEEAAMAFAGVMERFPDRSESMKMARQALEILSKQFGMADEAVREFKKKLKARLGGAATNYNDGIDARNQGLAFKSQGKTKLAIKRFLEAIDAFKKVKKVDSSTGKKVAYYGDSQSAIGDGYYQLYQLKGNVDYRKKALSILEKKLKEFKNRDQRGWAASAYYLARIYVDQEKYKKALEILKPFTRKLSGVKRYSVPAKSLIIRSAVASGESKIAEDEFNKLLKTAGPLSQRTAQAATLLTNTYSTFVEREQEKIRNGFKAYSYLYNRSNLVTLVDAKKIINNLLQKNKSGIPRLKSAQIQAAKYAVVLFNYYNKKNLVDFNRLYWLGGLVLNAGRYSKAITIFKMAVEMSPKITKEMSKSKKDMLRRYGFFARRFLAEAYLGLGKENRNLEYLSKALKRYDALSKEKAFETSVFMYRIFEGRALASSAIGQITAKKGQLLKAAECYRDFREKIRKFMSRREQYATIKRVDEPEIDVRYYEVTYNFFQLLFQLANFKEVRDRIQSLKNKKSNFGSPALKVKFEDLLKKCASRVN